jgi:D-proline reductase (dithiol) PrdB
MTRKPGSVDSYRFLDPLTARIVRAFVARETFATIPWTPLPRPLSACRVALVSSAAVRLRDDQPFDQQGERRDPWWGDPSFRVLPSTAATGQVAIDHLHIDTGYGLADLDTILPLTRLAELRDQGVVGEVAPSHYGFMGYTLRPRKLVEQSAPAMARRMRDEGVDAAALVPV